MAEAMATDAAARAAVEEEAIRARILKKRQRQSTCALVREQNWVIREMAGLPLKEEKVSGGEENSDNEQIRHASLAGTSAIRTTKVPGRTRVAVDDLHHSQTC
ncbi:hypothetical protein D1007_12253 [Hordeum vulgare]|nr:hypothetical protein D1007_12253 [Hordeum vulgare]